MKKSLILLIGCLLLTGCSSNETEQDKFKKYLQDSLFYSCKGNVCIKEEQLSTAVSRKYEFNLDTKTYTMECIIDNEKQKPDIYTFDWESDKLTAKIQIDNISYDVTFDYFTNQYSCNSVQKDEVECQMTQQDLIGMRSDVLEIFTNSKTNYYYAE